MDDCVQILLVTFPAQGHINPSLQFVKRLVKMGIHVTFLTAFSAVNRITKSAAAVPRDVTFLGFSDGHDDGFKAGIDYEVYMADLRRCGSEAVAKAITASGDNGKPIVHVVYATLLPWVSQVARDLHVPSTLLWNQPATILDIYYYSFYGYGDVLNESKISDPSWSIELPGLPRLTGRDLPSFLLAPNVYKSALPLFKEHIDTLDEETNPKILVNSFEALEMEALKAIGKLNFVAIGPLIPSAFLDGKDPSDNSFGGDLLQKSNDYIKWLDSKPRESVIYVAFGSYSALAKQQTEEVARGLLDCGRAFLWVMRGKENGEKEEEDTMNYEEELEQQGMIVPWCSQVEILSHSSVGCFVSHCGWNSSLESLVSGVPVVAFPQWTDQVTNAKLIEDVWKTGVRLTKNGEGIVDGGEVKRCIEMVMGGGGRGEEMRNNAKKWKNLAREATMEGGSSDKNLKAFVDEVRAR
ncbi:crocetin glucosyltransferase, chloroplastic-like [Rhododendron vialii]|uniref:crocetin glucosyltransferase, chloroplastic-like n=1 Tax=Rhododendron vialii TaxID=182163 RepID=UPI00265E4AE7|nr:crocetin glucosyltransferase, chloroplastic-like [Rhododendron vialii]